MTDRNRKSKTRRLDISLRKISERYPGFDPLLICAEIAQDMLIREDPLTGLPVNVPCTNQERLSALKILLDKTVPSLKAVEHNLDADLVEERRVLAHVPLEDIISALAADAGVQPATDRVKH